MEEKTIKLGLAAALVAVAHTAWAVDFGTRGEDGDWSFSLGAGVALEPEYEGSKTYQAAPLPIVEVKYRDLAFLSAQKGLGWNAFRTRNFRVGPVATYYLGSNDRPTGIGDVDPGVQVGAFAEYAFDHWKFDTRVLYSVSGSSEGGRVNLGAAYGTRIEKVWQVILRANVTLLNDNEMKTYFGINAREASDSGLAEHSPSAGFSDVGLDLNVIYEYSKAWSILGIARAHYLVGDAADSPLVKDKGTEFQFYGGLGVAYNF